MGCDPRRMRASRRGAVVGVPGRPTLARRTRPWLGLVSILSLVAWVLWAGQAYSQPPEYTLGVGDVLRVTVFGREDLSGQFGVRAPGIVALPLIGPIYVAGLTMSDLEATAAERLHNDYQISAPVTVDIVQYRPFYIVGDVRNPGSYPYVSGMVVLQAVAIAGGYFVAEPSDRRRELDAISARENLKVLEGQYWSEIARNARLVAERDGLEEISLPESVLVTVDDPSLAEFLDPERRILQVRRKSLDEEINIISRQIDLYEQEIAALEAEFASNSRQKELVDLQLEDTRSLFDKGLARKSTLLELERVQAAIDGDRHEVRALLARARQQIAKSEQEIQSLRNNYILEVEALIRESGNGLAELEVRLEAARQMVAASELFNPARRSPVSARTRESYLIVRSTADGIEELVANELTAVLPGDVVRVPVLESTGGTPVLTELEPVPMQGE